MFSSQGLVGLAIVIGCLYGWGPVGLFYAFFGAMAVLGALKIWIWGLKIVLWFLERGEQKREKKAQALNTVHFQLIQCVYCKTHSSGQWNCESCGQPRLYQG